MEKRYVSCKGQSVAFACCDWRLSWLMSTSISNDYRRHPILNCGVKKKMSSKIEFLFDFASPNAYLSYHALSDIAKRFGVSRTTIYNRVGVVKPDREGTKA